MKVKFKGIELLWDPWFCHCGGIVDYIYHTFWQCRRCRGWYQWMPRV